MSSPQRNELRGQMLEKKERAADLAILMHGLRDQINRATNPHKPIDELDTKKLGALLDDLHEKRQEHTRLCKEIRALCEDLGEKMPDVS